MLKSKIIYGIEHLFRFKHDKSNKQDIFATFFDALIFGNHNCLHVTLEMALYLKHIFFSLEGSNIRIVPTEVLKTEGEP